MLSRASTTRRRLNRRRVGSGRDCGVRASGLQDPGLDRRPGDSRRRRHTDHSTGAAAPVFRQGIGVQSFLRSRSAAIRIPPARVWDRFPWLRAKPKRLEAWNTSPKRVCAGGAGESGRCVSPREPRHFSQGGRQAAALSRIPARAAASLRGVPPRFRAVLAAFR